MCLFLGSLILNLSMNFKDGSILMLEKEYLIDKKNDKFYFITGLDKFLDKAAPTGNLLLKFKGFGVLNRESDTDTSLIMYFRAVYHLYPRKVFTVANDVIVNTGEDLYNNPFNPSKDWMTENGVTTVITLTKDNNGQIRQEIQKNTRKF